MAYATVEDVRRVLGKENLTVDQTTLITRLILSATAQIDTETGQFFETRNLTFKTEAPDLHTRKLFFPAKVQSITSITEDGELLVEGNDEDFIIYDFWAVREDGRFWDIEPQRTVVIGVFGPVTTPADIVQACAEIAGMMSGLNQVSFVEGDGIAQSIVVTNLPAYVQKILKTHTIQRFSSQNYRFV